MTKFDSSPAQRKETPSVKTLQEELLNTILDVPDFPKPGILFKDIAPVLRHPRLFKRLIRTLAEQAESAGAEQIVGAESRGFLFGAPLAVELGIPFALARKKGKLPGRVLSQTYELEYGTDVLEMQANALKPGQRNLIIDDVIATGGTAAAIGKLIKGQGAILAGYSFVLELSFLNGRDVLNAVEKDVQIQSVLVL